MKGVLKKRRNGGSEGGGRAGGRAGAALDHESRQDVKLSKHIFLFFPQSEYKRINTKRLTEERSKVKASEARKWERMKDDVEDMI